MTSVPTTRTISHVLATLGLKAPAGAASAKGRAAAFAAEKAGHGQPRPKLRAAKPAAEPSPAKKPSKKPSVRSAVKSNGVVPLAASASRGSEQVAKKSFRAVIADTLGRHFQAKDRQIAATVQGNASDRQSVGEGLIAVLPAPKKQANVGPQTGKSRQASTAPPAAEPQRTRAIKARPAAAASARILTHDIPQKPAPANGRPTLQSPALRKAGSRAGDATQQKIRATVDAPIEPAGTKPTATNGRPTQELPVHTEAQRAGPSLAERLARPDSAQGETPQATPEGSAAVARSPEFVEILDAPKAARPRPVAGKQAGTSQAPDGPSRPAIPAKAVAAAPKAQRHAEGASRPGLDARVQIISAGSGSQTDGTAGQLEIDPAPPVAQTHAAQGTGAGRQPMPAGNSEAAPQSAADQIVAQFRANTGRHGQQVVIRLNPPELGRVKLRLLMQGRGLRGELKVSNPETLEQLRTEAPNLCRQLTDSGIQIRRLDMSLEDQGPEQQTDWLGREGHRQEQERPGEWFDPQAQEAPNQHSASNSDPDAAPQTKPGADGSINLWV